MSPPLYTVMNGVTPSIHSSQEARPQERGPEAPHHINLSIECRPKRAKADAEALISERIARRCGASARGRSHTRSVHDKESDGR